MTFGDHELSGFCPAEIDHVRVLFYLGASQVPLAGGHGRHPLVVDASSRAAESGGPRQSVMS